MKVKIIFILLLKTGVLFGQNNYTINKAIWTYTRPENYKIRVDNFSSTIKRGDSVLIQNTEHSSQNNDDNILISVAKSDSIDMNVIMADYKDNSSITNFTMKGYIAKLKEFLQDTYGKLGSDATINSKEISIDGIMFSIVETKIYHKEKNYTYWTEMFIAEISGKEFSISAAFDNNIDKMKIEESILKSKFVLK